MQKQRNNDVYNHPQSEEEVNQEVRVHNTEGNKTEQTIVANPNPRANENIKDKNIFANENSKASQAGSEITDGEDG